MTIDDQPMAGADYYKARAAMMRAQAHLADSDKARFVYLELASYWDQMAQVMENAGAVKDALAAQTSLHAREAAENESAEMHSRSIRG